MAKGRELKGRIKSIEGTRKITRTMEMVATSKLKRAQDRVVAARPYARALAGVIADLYSPALAERFPLLRQPQRVRHAAVLLITSNRGLAGAFNTNLIREARQLAARLERDGVTVDLHVVGRKGIGFFRYIGRAMVTARSDIGDRPTTEHAAELVQGEMSDFIAGRLDAVYVVYAKYNSPLSTPPTTEQILPLYVRNAVYRALVETAAGEQGARRTAMKNATDNAGEMLNVLRRTYNRARQAQITQEIAEIVGGAEALEGGESTSVFQCLSGT